MGGSYTKKSAAAKLDELDAKQKSSGGSSSYMRPEDLIVLSTRQARSVIQP